MYACSPAVTLFSINCRTRSNIFSFTQYVSISFRPFGNSSIIDTSIPATVVIACVLGLGVAVLNGQSQLLLGLKNVSPSQFYFHYILTAVIFLCVSFLESR